VRVGVADPDASEAVLVEHGLSVRRDGDLLFVEGVADTADITRLLAERGHYVRELTAVSHDLESVFLEVTEGEWDRVIDTNLKGCFFGTQAAARHMKEHGGGSVINIGSGSNKTPFPGLVAYTASKGGIEMLTRVAAVELGPHRIRVNCVAPGAIEIPRTRLELPDYAGTWGSRTPLRRVGTPEDVGNAVTFLATDAASFINGQTIWVDGGLFTQPPWPEGGQGDDVQA